MAKLPCGCDFIPGSQIPEDFLAKHFEHTTMAMILWELLIFKPRDPIVSAMWELSPLMAKTWNENRLKVSEARIAYLEALKTAFPIELKEV